MNNSISDELSVRNLIARLARAGDTAPTSELELLYRSGFTDDADLEARTGAAMRGDFQAIRQGKAEIFAGAIERRDKGWQGPGSHSLHVVTTTEIQQNGDQAGARSCFLILTRLNRQPQIGTARLYDDTSRRDSLGWRLTRALLSRSLKKNQSRHRHAPKFRLVHSMALCPRCLLNKTLADPGPFRRCSSARSDCSLGSPACSEPQCRRAECLATRQRLRHQSKSWRFPPPS